MIAGNIISLMNNWEKKWKAVSKQGKEAITFPG